MKRGERTTIAVRRSSGPSRAARIATGIVIAAVVAGCVKRREAPPEAEGRADSFEVQAAQLAGKPMPPEEAKELLGDLAGNWFYGRGIGETALSAGAIVVFPPYALYLLGNSVLSMSGYEPIYITDALPDDERRAFDSAYADLTSAPGKLNAAIAGKEFRTVERVDQSLKKYTNEVQ